MRKKSPKQLLSAIASTSSKNYTKSLEDLQYNLSTFLNEDVYFSEIEKYGEESMLIVKYLLKSSIIYITAKDDRVLLTPVGESLLIELNNMLFYV